MSESHQTHRFEDLARDRVLAIGDGYRAKLEELGGDGPLFFRAGALTDNGFSWTGLDSFRNDVGDGFKTKLGFAGDVVITTKGNSIGRVGFVPSEAPRFVYSPHLSYWRSLNPEILHSRYLYYWSRSDCFWSQLRQLAFGTDMAPYFSLRDQYRLRIPLPSVPRQQAIAEVLGSLDEKIATNAKLASTFDEYLAALLMKALRETDVTEVALGSIADVNAGVVKPVVGGFLRYIDIASVRVGGFDFPGLTAWHDAPSRARRRVLSGDTLWSTVRPNRRSHALNLSDDPALVASTGIAVLSPRVTGFAYLYEITRSPHFTTFLESAAEGSAYPAVRAERFGKAPVPLLRPSALESFEEVAAPLRQHAFSLQEEDRSLAAIRDTLLPQLMSGKLRVKDAEKQVEAVA